MPILCLADIFLFNFNMKYCFQNDKDKSNIKTLIEAIKESKEGKTIAVYAKDKFPSELIDAWRRALKEAQFEQVCSILFVF